jgi:hypothetical protein
MELFFDETDGTKIWSTNCDAELRRDPWMSSPSPSSGGVKQNRRSTRSTRRATTAALPTNKLQSPNSLVFYGAAHDAKKAFLFGRIYALPPQQGIPGFQRMVLKKFYLDNARNFNPNDVYYYEGCVFPGGKIILGRWWLAGQDCTPYDQFSGPFLWWAVDHTTRTEDNNPEEILEFARIYNTSS